MVSDLEILSPSKRTDTGNDDTPPPPSLKMDLTKADGTYIVLVKRAFSVIPVSAAAQARPKIASPQNTWCAMYMVRAPYPSFGNRNAINPHTH